MYTSMLSAFRYRLYSAAEQEKRLNRSLLLLCNLYNDLKAEEIRRYREEHMYVYISDNVQEACN